MEKIPELSMTLPDLHLDRTERVDADDSPQMTGIFVNNASVMGTPKSDLRKCIFMIYLYHVGTALVRGEQAVIAPVRPMSLCQNFQRRDLPVNRHAAINRDP